MLRACLTCDSSTLSLSSLTIVSTLCIRFFTTPLLCSNWWLLLKCKYWFVWVSLWHTLALIEPSSLITDQVSKNASAQSDLIPLFPSSLLTVCVVSSIRYLCYSGGLLTPVYESSQGLYVYHLCTVSTSMVGGQQLTMLVSQNTPYITYRQLATPEIPLQHHEF